MARRPMISPVSVANVNLWGIRIGALSWDDQQGIGFFEYDHDFLRSGIQVSPIHLPLKEGVFSFPNLNRQTYKGLPGLLADCMPDKFGHAMINAWLVRQGRDPNEFTPLERLCYIGKRAMGALEFEPNTSTINKTGSQIDIDALVGLANHILNQRESWHQELTDASNDIGELIQVGTSAGGARAKAVIAWNPITNDIRSGQVDNDTDYEHWLIKFDGISNNRDKELTDPQGFGVIEYSYYEMAIQAGIEMMTCRLLEENKRQHFMTRRFDRTSKGNKLHMQTLCGLAHLDFNEAGGSSYEQAFSVMQTLGLPKIQLEALFRRMLFNVAARNQDDHTKNISFLMNKKGEWSLAPAYDITYSYNPHGEWTNQHQMSINGKRDSFTLDDFMTVADRFSIMKTHVKRMISDVNHAVSEWPMIANKNAIAPNVISSIQKTHRMIK